jgi:Na+-translocating ferredoxin:NAD+ oxidoreductase RnfG subunit
MLPASLREVEAMETVWGAVLAFLFVMATALSGHLETPSKEQIEQMEKARKEMKEQVEKADKERKEQVEKAEKEKKEQKEKAEKVGKSKQKEKSKQREPEAWRLRP